MSHIQKKSEWLLNYNFKNSEDNKARPVVLRKKICTEPQFRN